MKRILSLICTICLACAVFTAQAELTTELSASVNVVDNEFTLTYTLPQNDVGLWSIGFFVEFSTDSVELISVENSGLYETDSEWYTPSADLISRANDSGEYKYFASYNSLTTNMDKSGVLCTLKFRLYDDVPPSIPVIITTRISDGDCLHANANYTTNPVSVIPSDVPEFSFWEMWGNLMGDCNLDGMVSVSDARKVLFAVANDTAQELSEKAFINADMDANGSLSVSDARKILIAVAQG